MSMQRFEFLKNCPRFDDKTTRDERKETDKMADFRKVWDLFIQPCLDMYAPGDNLPVDEQLLLFRGKCPFRMYIPNKPAKYGLTFVLCNDNHSKYLLGGIPYLGKQKAKPKDKPGLGHYYTKELTKPYHTITRNVMTDKWFTLVAPTLDRLSNCGMTLAGTIKCLKEEIPDSMKEKFQESRENSIPLHQGDGTRIPCAPQEDY